MADSKIFGGLITAFVVIVIGINLLSTSSDTISTTADTYTSTNDSFTGVDSTAVEIIAAATFDMITVSAVRNSTGQAQTVLTQYNFTAATNSITVYNGNGTYFVDYTYRSDDYINDGAARSMSNLIKIFFALAVFMSALIFVPWKDLGMK